MTDIGNALARFDRKSRTGEFHTGRYLCRYLACGSGPLLTIVHGLADRARSFALLVDRLAPHFRCVAYELPNGLDDAAALGRYRHRDYVSDFLSLLDHLGADRTVLLGTSFGSTIALAAAAVSGRVERLILQGGFARRPLKRHERWLAAFARTWPGRMHHLAVRRQVMARMDRPAFAAAPPEAYEFFLECSGATPLRAAARRALLLGRLDLRPLLSAIRRPVLMIGGDGDRIVPRWCEAEVEGGLPDVRRVEFARCGHYPQYTHPSAMAEAIRAFAAG